MTGQLVVRETGIDKNGKKIFMVFGLVGADQLEALSLFGESQYTIKNLELTDPVNIEKITIGSSPDSIFQQPIWRV